MLASVAGHREARREKYYYGGTISNLVLGQAMCFDVAASVGTARDSRFAKVVQPATANLNLFAGILAAIPNPGDKYVTLYVPERGRVCPALVKANATVSITALAPTNAANWLVAHSDSTTNLPMIAVAGETADTSTTEARKLIYFL